MTAYDVVIDRAGIVSNYPSRFPSIIRDVVCRAGQKLKQKAIAVRSSKNLRRRNPLSGHPHTVSMFCFTIALGLLDWPEHEVPA